MKNLDRYLDEVKKGIPDIETRLNAGAEKDRLEQVARKIGDVLPAQLLELYRRFDGEDMAVLVKHFCNTLFEKFTTCSVLQMVSSSCCTNAV